MAVDYDLVIVGETLEAREAAAIASRQGARVALVLSVDRLQTSLQVDLLGQVLTHWGNSSAATQEGSPSSPTLEADRGWPMLRQAVEMAGQLAHPHLSLESLAMQGIDVVTDAGYFSPKPRLVFTTEQRTLTARAYLIACGSHSVIPAIPGLAESAYITLETLLSLETQPQSLAILGRSSAAIALAQTFSNLGIQVTLITRGERLLPKEDPDVSQFIETLLIAAGVDVRLESRVERVQSKENSVVIQLTGSAPILVERLLLATGPRPAVQGLNLERVGVQQDSFGLQVNSRLQTTHPRIYAAGSVLGDSRQGSFARHEIQIALHNALYFPTRSLNRHILPYTLGITPELGRVGLTEMQAHQAYGADTQVCLSTASESVKAHLQEDTIGFCKLVAHRNGKILGASLIGPQAGDLVQSLAMLMAEKGKMSRLATFPAVPHTLTELLTHTAQQWQQTRWQPGRWRRDWSENWFNWRRSSQR
ncbi:MAG TPA: NAD(P)/FAD-dependent oxidoreductase [Leptolyngbyaceae cyanobacterium]